MDKCAKKNAATAASAPKPQTTPPDFQSIFPGGITADALFDARTEKIVRCFADKLVRTGAFVQHEREDIEQEFRILLLRKMPAFDPTRSNRYVFAGMLLANAYKNALKARDRERKRTGDILSFQVVLDDSGDTLEDCMSVDDYEQLLGRQSMPAETRRFFHESLELFFASLTEEDRNLCICYMESRTIEETARRTGLAASTIRWRLRTRIRSLAVRAGLDDFCGGAK